MNIQRQLGKSLAAALTAHQYSGGISSITAEYRRRPDFLMHEVDELRVSVVPGPISTGVPDAPRGATFFELTYGIVLSCAAPTEARIEELEDLNQEIMDELRSGNFGLGATYGGLDYRELGQQAPFDAETLTRSATFLSQIEVTYTIPRAKV